MNQSVQEILQKVTESGCLGTSERQLKMFRYLLKEQDRDRLINTKAYNIAVDVLGRRDDFDPSSDSIVRVEMHRLRKNLELFNLGSNEFTVTIPRASYKVVTANKASRLKRVWLKLPVINSLAAVAVLLVLCLILVHHSPIHNSVASNNFSTVLPNVNLVSTDDSSNIYSYVGSTIRASLDQYKNIQMVNDIQACSKSGTPSFDINFSSYKKPIPFA